MCWKNISSTCCDLHLKPVGAHPHRCCCIVLPHVCVMFRVGGGQGLFQDVVCEDGCTLVSVPFVVCASLSIINNLFIVAVFPCWPPKACSLNHVWLKIMMAVVSVYAGAPNCIVPSQEKVQSSLSPSTSTRLFVLIFQYCMGFFRLFFVFYRICTQTQFYCTLTFCFRRQARPQPGLTIGGERRSRP